MTALVLLVGLAAAPPVVVGSKAFTEGVIRRRQFVTKVKVQTDSGATKAGKVQDVVDHHGI